MTKNNLEITVLSRNINKQKRQIFGKYHVVPFVQEKQKELMQRIKITKSIKNR